MSNKQAFIDKYKNVEVLPCPFCGNEDVRVGAKSCLSWGVTCTCGASVELTMPNKYTKAEKEELNNLEKILSLNWDEAMHYLHSLQAIEKWNKRK